MHDGAVGAVGGDGVEREAAEQRLLGTQGGELFADGKLGEQCVGLNLPVEPAEEFDHGDAVAQHRHPKPRLFGGVFDGLHAFDGRLGLHLLACDGTVERVVYFVGVNQDIVFEIVLQALCHVAVVVHLDAVLCQIGRDGRRELLLIDI